MRYTNRRLLTYFTLLYSNGRIEAEGLFKVTAVTYRVKTAAFQKDRHTITKDHKQEMIHFLSNRAICNNLT